MNARNRGKNIHVDGVDSRATLAEEFMGTGDAANDAFKKVSAHTRNAAGCGLASFSLSLSLSPRAFNPFF